MNIGPYGIKVLSCFLKVENMLRVQVWLCFNIIPQENVPQVLPKPTHPPKHQNEILPGNMDMDVSPKL